MLQKYVAKGSVFSWLLWSLVLSLLKPVVKLFWTSVEKGVSKSN